MKRARLSQSGFTLIELMVVTLIIGLLVAIALPNFASMTDRARMSGLKSNAHLLQVVIESDCVVRGEYPAATTEIASSDAYKVFANPLTDKIGPGAPGNGAWCLSTDGASDGAALPAGYTGGIGTAGQVVYVPVTEAGTAVSTAAGTRNATAGQARGYLIFGIGTNNQPMPRFLIANGLPNGVVPANAAALLP